jgi:hypothetical protein
LSHSPPVPVLAMESHAAAVNYAAAAPRDAGRGRRWLRALGAAAIAAVLLAGFLAYRDPSLALSLENLRLCF